jgi:tetratricopeptide (TPR) repeat protein
LASSAERDPRRKLVLSMSAVIASPASADALGDLADVLLWIHRDVPSLNISEFAGDAERSRLYHIDGTTSAEQGSLRAATMQFALSLVDSPLSVGGHNNLACVLMAIGRNEQALRHLDLAETLLPRDPRVANNRAIAWFQTGEVNRAIAEFERLASGEPVARQNHLAAVAWRDNRTAPAPRLAFLYSPPPPSTQQPMREPDLPAAPTPTE